MTLAEAQEQLDAWKQANLALATGKSYKLANGIQVDRESSKQVLAQIAYWERMVARLTPNLRSGRMTRRVTPFDL